MKIENTRKYNVGGKPCVAGDKKFKGKLNTKQNKGSDDLRPRPYSAEFSTYEREFKESLISEGNQGP